MRIRSGIGAAVIAAVAVIGLCSSALASDRELDGRTGSVTAMPTGSLDVQPAGMVARGGGPTNDNCEDAPVDTLNIGDTLTYNGDLTGATSTCAALGTLGETWHAFDLTADADVTGDHCGTDPVFGNAFIVLDQSCPCSGAFIFATSFDQTTCADGNWAIHYNGLPAGVYYSPVILDPVNGNDGPYVWNISAAEGGGPVCGPGNGDCCVEGGNGTPGCDDEACCEEICALDPFCCDISWDGICADEAQDFCDICGGGGEGPGGCEGDDECDDGDACTDDACVDGQCVNTEIDCDDGDQCTDDFCVDGACQSEDNGECCPGCDTCDGDVNCDGSVDPLDSGAVLARFGLDPCNEENCRYDVNCDGSIDPLDSGYILARFGVCNEPEVCKICGDAGNVFNDDCSDAPVDTLNIGQTLSYEGTLEGATSTCAALGSLGETWHAFDLTADADVTGSHCGTSPVFGNAFIVLDQSCPCSGSFIFATSFDQVTCTDGNWAIHYNGLPAGVYYSPVILDPVNGNEGKYIWNISAAEGGGPVCGPGNGDCCVDGGNGTPGCDDEACCEEICALDPFCCDTSWDGICADEAQDFCDICG